MRLTRTCLQKLNIFENLKKDFSGPGFWEERNSMRNVRVGLNSKIYAHHSTWSAKFVYPATWVFHPLWVFEGMSI